MAKITFLGTGNASVPAQFNANGTLSCPWQSNLLLESDGGKKFLLDCGTDIRFSTAEQGIQLADIDGMYISHIHADHIGGMECLGFGRHFVPNPRKLYLFCTGDTLSGLRESLTPGLSPLEGRQVGLEDFFVVERLLTTHPYGVDGSLTIQPVRAIHVPGEVQKFSYGLFITNTVSGKSVFWTSDTVFEETKYDRWYEGADIILQDCELGYKSGVHAHFDDLRTLPRKFKKKMILYHHDPVRVTKSIRSKGGFGGFAYKGQVVEF